MRELGIVLILAGMLWMIFELFSPGLLPSFPSSQSLSFLAIGAGLILLWLSERGRKRRRWKGLGKTPKYFE